MTKPNKKQAILIALTLALGMGLFGCGKGPATNVNQNANADINQNQNTNVNTNISTTTDEIGTINWKTYRNEELGISFGYDEFDQYSGKPHLIKKIDNEIMLYVQGNNFGHTITLFNIDRLSPQEYIKENFMKDVDPRCRIETKKGKNNENLKYSEDYLVLYITSYDPENSVDSVYGINCGKYGNANAIAYFLYNSKVKNKLIHVSLGQDTSLKHYWDYLSSIKIF